MTADVIVVGLGVMGAATAYSLASRGVRVLGLDRYSPPHAHGSSHGKTRIIREAYFEHPAYVSLVQHAYARWAEVEHESASRLLTQTGGLMIGPPGGAVAGGAELSARTYGLAYERLSPRDVTRRFPALRLAEDMVGIFEPRAGVLFAEQCVAALLSLARRNGAQVVLNQRVLSWSSTADGVLVTTADSEYSADHLVLAVGPWVSSLISDLNVRFEVERTRMFWLRDAAHKEFFHPDRLPIFLIEYAAGRLLYGFPNLGDGIKVAIHHEGDAAGPDDDSADGRAASQLTHLRELLARHLPSANGELLDAATCYYTNTPDLHFVLDFHPAAPRVLIVSPCSGHGFKFAPAIGDIAADLVVNGRSAFDLELFSLKRFGGKAGGVRPTSVN